jgi:hypothetical protein
VSVAELQKIQAAENEAERQQKIEAIAAYESQLKAENEAAKTVKRQAGDFSEPKAKRQDCEVSKPETGTALPSLPPSSSPTAPTPIPSSVRSTEWKPATVCQSLRPDFVCSTRPLTFQVASSAASSAGENARQDELKRMHEKAEQSLQEKQKASLQEKQKASLQEKQKASLQEKQEASRLQKEVCLPLMPAHRQLPLSSRAASASLSYSGAQ